jgi:hypothetical protein
MLITRSAVAKRLWATGTLPGTTLVISMIGRGIQASASSQTNCMGLGNLWMYAILDTITL